MEDSSAQGNSFLSILNETIINMFEQTLLSLERGTFDVDKQAVMNLKKEHARELNSFSTPNIL